MAAGLRIAPNSLSYYMALMQIDLHKVVAKKLKREGNFTRFFRGSSSSSSSSSNTDKYHVRTTTSRLSFLAAAKSSTEINGVAVPIPDFIIPSSPFSGLDDVMMGYILGKRKATEVAHLVWRHIVQKGDALVDATCGNGYDTLAMVKMVADKSLSGRVYALDLQNVALENTSSLLDKSLDFDEKGLVGLYPICHSKMEEVVPKGVPVRLVAFNLGYLPGGDKGIITRSETTLQALEAAKRMLAPGGLISLVVYVGHPGGREEFEAVESFASGLPIENWTCCKLQMLNRPLAPILVLLLKR